MANLIYLIFMVALSQVNAQIRIQISSNGEDSGEWMSSSSSSTSKIDEASNLPSRSSSGRGIRITVRFLRQLGFDPTTTNKINLAKMNVSRLDDHVFDSYIQLRILNLNANSIDFISNRTFANTSQLENLTLYQNRLSQIGSNSFRGCVRLRLLNLGTNRIKYIEPGSFNGLKNLEVLDLAGNRIDRLNSEVFRELDRLRWIYLRGNPLVIIDSNLFKNMAIPPNTDLGQLTTIKTPAVQNSTTTSSNHFNSTNPIELEKTTTFARDDSIESSYEEKNETESSTIDNTEFEANSTIEISNSTFFISSSITTTPSITSTSKSIQNDLPCCNQTILNKQLMQQFQLYQKQLLEQFQSYQKQLQLQFELIQTSNKNDE